jgi:hypothetical protein
MSSNISAIRHASGEVFFEEHTGGPDTAIERLADGHPHAAAEFDVLAVAEALPDEMTLIRQRLDPNRLASGGYAPSSEVDDVVMELLARRAPPTSHQRRRSISNESDGLPGWMFFFSRAAIMSAAEMGCIYVPIALPLLAITVPLDLVIIVVALVSMRLVTAVLDYARH